MVWGLVYTSICTYCTVASHSELFAVYPTAAGQYHWVYMVAPKRIRTSLSWFTGMINVVGLWMGNAAAAYLCCKYRPLLFWWQRALPASSRLSSRLCIGLERRSLSRWNRSSYCRPVRAALNDSRTPDIGHSSTSPHIRDPPFSAIRHLCLSCRDRFPLDTVHR